MAQEKMRTVTLSLPFEAAPLKRQEFAKHLKDVGVMDYLEACGSTDKSHIWEFIFTESEASNHFREQGNFFTESGHQAKIVANRKYIKQRYFLRLHWVPYNVRIAKACKLFCENQNFKIIAARYETPTEEGFESVRTGVRVITVETDLAFLISHFTNWSYGGATRKALITMKGRPMVCLRCKMERHRKMDCKEEQCKKCFLYGRNAEDPLKPPLAPLLM
jgi:hypothetical protein